MPKAKAVKDAVDDVEFPKRSKIMIYRYGERKIVAPLPTSYAVCRVLSGKWT